MTDTELRHVWGYMDSEWYCVDLGRRVAFLTTGGYGNELLEALFESNSTRNFALLVKSLPETSPSITVTENGDISDWIAMSKRGLYGFDYLDGVSRGPYVTITRPVNPLVLSAEKSASVPMIPVRFAENVNIEIAAFGEVIRKHLRMPNP
jgi:hypothetical protein